MAHLLSNQDDFKNQVSMLEELICQKGHKIIFLPKFHCELNPIEMACGQFFLLSVLLTSNSTGDGLNTAIGRQTSKLSRMLKMWPSSTLMPVLLRLYTSSSTNPGGLLMHIGRDSQEQLQNGQCRSRSPTALFPNGP
jgi:hypothetical protein